MNTKKIKIVSDGTTHGTYVLLPDGSKLPGIISIQWKISANMSGEATIKLLDVEIDAIGDMKNG